MFVMENIKSVPLTRGAVSLISSEDFEKVSKFKWHLTSHGYVSSNVNNKRVYLHRFINNTPDGFFTDHKDGNKLNNTRENLRTATISQNTANSVKNRKGGTSKFKGVYYELGRGKDPQKTAKWVAGVKNGKIKSHLGHFKTELDAALAYNIKAKELFGEFALLNPIPSDFTKTEPEKFIFRKYSKFIGVSFNKHLGYWTSKLGKKPTYHKTELEAAEAYNKAAIAAYGEKAKLNPLPEYA